MDYISASEAAKKWNISKRRVVTLCINNRIVGAQKIGTNWAIPSDAQKPVDGRTKEYRKMKANKTRTFTSIDLFAGPGGLCTGFRWAGIKALIAVEWSYWTVQTYAASHDAEIFNLEDYLSGKMEDSDSFFLPSEKTLLIYGDINKVEKDLIMKILNERFGVSSVDIVTGGAPCESFSMAGDRKEDDERNELYQNVLRIARAVNSRMFLFENVKGLFSKKLNGVSGGMYEAICGEFESKFDNRPSFHLVSNDKKTVLLKAADYGVPQARERLFLVGINDEVPGNVSFTYPEKTHGPGCKFNYVTVGDALMDLPQIESGLESNWYDYSVSSEDSSEKRNFLSIMRGELSMTPEHLHFQEHSLYNHKAPGHTKKMSQRISLIKPGESMKTAAARLIEEGRGDLVKECFPKTIYGSRNRRLLLNEPCFTVTSHCLDEMVHPTLNRGLSPREAARLQSFPDWYQFQGPYVKFHSDPEQDQYEQIGDAIPPLLGYALGREVCNTLQMMEEKPKQ